MIRVISALFLALVGLVPLSGCGGGGTGTAGNAAPKNTLAESGVCITCHDTGDLNHSVSVTPGTGQPAVTEWKASSHNSMNGAGCIDCHGSGYLHTTTPNSCSGCHTIGGQASSPIHNPDAEGKCATCHDKVNPRPGQHDGYNPLTYTDAGIPAGSTTAYTHFSTGRHGTYVSTNYKQYCRKCHNPHDTSSGREQRKQWAESGHGGTRNAFITGSTDFKGRGSRLAPQDNQGAYCVRCHTTTGFVNFVRSGFSDTQALPDFDGVRNNYPELPRATYQDKSREGINCNACHDDGRPGDESAYSGRVRAVPAPSIWYMYSSHPAGMAVVRARHNVQFDSLGRSNVCVPCHAGREDGKIIKMADIDANLFTYPGAAPSAIRPHDFPAAANLQGKSGFDFYTSAAKYSYNPAHKSGIGGADGPCITCHLKNDRSHSYRPVDWANDNQSGPIELVRSLAVCNGCHTGSGQRTVANLNSERDLYRAAVIALGKMIPSGNNWKALGNNPVPGSGTLSALTGTYVNVRGGAYTMGASFVQVLFFNDPAGYAHNPIYTKQLIYDAIDWLAGAPGDTTTGQMDFGNASDQVIQKVTATVAAASATMTWDKGTPRVNYGQLGIPISAGGVPFTKTQVFRFICKDFDLLNADVENPAICNRW